MTDISIIIPAKNESAAVADVIADLHQVLGALDPPREYEILLVDDGSDDGTGEIAEKAGARVVRHPYAIGNGGAVKSGMRNAKGDVLVMMDADGQHAPADVPRLLALSDQYPMVVGARTRGTGTGVHRGLANFVYNTLASYVVNRKVEDLTSGFRAIHRTSARRFIYLLPNTFSYPTTITLAFFRAGLPVAYVPISAAKRVGQSHIRIVRDGIRFLLILIKIATIFSPMKVFLPAAGLAFLGGMARYAWTFSTTHRFTNASLLAFVLAIVLFALALISEQVAALRFDRSEQEL